MTRIREEEVFPYQTSWQYSDRDLLMGASDAGGVGTVRDRRRYSWTCEQQCNNPPCSLSHRRRCVSEAVFITACSMHDHDEEKRRERTCEQVRQSTVQFIAQTTTHQWSYVYHSLQHARPRQREENIIYLYTAVNLKRNLHSRYCTIEARDRHEASHSLSATVGLLVLLVDMVCYDVYFLPTVRYALVSGVGLLSVLWS